MRRSAARRVGVPVIAFVVAVAGLVMPARAAGGEEQPARRGPGDSGPTFVPRPGTARSSRDDPTAAQSRAEQDGTARVIVRLDVDWHPRGGDRTSSAARTQQLSIAAERAGLRADLQGTEHRFVREFDRLPFVALEASPAAIDRLRSSPHVDAVEIDDLAVVTLDDSIPVIGGDSAHAAGYTGAGAAVAILDTGVDAGHALFGGRVVAEACFSTGSDCPNNGTTQTGPGAAAPCAFAPSDCEHGTHVAGISAGSAAGRTGVAPQAGIVAIQVFSQFSGVPSCGAPGACALSYDSDQIAGLEHVLDLATDPGDPIPIAAANLSLGGGLFSSSCDATETATKAAIDNLLVAGVATVIASGNDGSTSQISAPGCISSGVTVGSTTTADVVSSFSNSSDQVDVLAPGSDITSSIPGGGFDSFSGTSMATPHVAGAWALLKGASPSAPVATVLGALQSGGVAVTDTRAGAGNRELQRISVHAAVAALNGDACPPDDAHEDDDTLATASLLVAGTGSAGFRCSGDDDLFLVPGIGGATLNVDLDFTHADGDLDLQLLDAVGSTIATSATTTDDEHISLVLPSTGHFYVKVLGAAPTVENAFFLRTTVDQCAPNEPTEPNGSTGQAVALGLPGIADGVSCSRGGNPNTGAGYDEDYYAVSLSTGDELHAELFYEQAFGTVLLRVADGTDFLQSSIDGPSREVLDFTAPSSGTYYLVVYALPADDFPYRLSAALASVDTPPTVAVTSPVQDGTVRGPVTLSADASDDVGVTQVEFFVDDLSVGLGQQDDVDTWSLRWSSAALGDGQVHTITAEATDTTAQVGASDAVSVLLLSDAVADLDGDGDSDVGVFRPSGGRWYVEGVAGYTNWGTGTDVPVPGDYTGDGTTDIAIYRPSNGRWYIEGLLGYTVWGGQAGDIPVPADYTGDGITDIAVFRPSQGRWYINGIPGSTQFGLDGDIPLPGDHDGDGTTDLAVFRPSNGRWYINGVAGYTNWGTGTDIPVPADYTGDGATDIAIYRPSNGRWYIEGLLGYTVWGGQAGDIPVPADYTGDGATDIAVFRPSTGRWYINGIPGSTQFGLDGDIPLTKRPGT